MKDVFFSIHNILKIRSNTEIPIPDHFKTTEIIKTPDIWIIQEDFNIDLHSSGKQRKDYFIWVDRKNTSLIMDYKFLGARLCVSNVMGRTIVKFTETYRRFGKKHIQKLVETLTMVKLIHKGFVPIHAGCVYHRPTDTAFLISGMGSTGKTSTALSLIDGLDWYFMGDDTVILSRDGHVYSYPQKVGVSFQTHTGMLSKNSRTKTMSMLTKHHLLSLFFGKIFNLWRVEQKEIPEKMIVDTAPLRKVVLISCGDIGDIGEMKRIDADKAVAMLLMTTMDEHSIFGSYILNFYSYLFGLDFFSMMKMALCNAVQNVECFELRANEIRTYVEMVRGMDYGI